MGQTIILLLFLPVYACTIMAALLDIRRSSLTKKKRLQAAGLVTAAVLLSAFVFLRFGRLTYLRFYVLLVQLPIYLLFRLISEYRGIKLLFTMVTTVTLSALPVEFVMFFRILTGGNSLMMLIGFCLSFLLALFLVFRLLRPSFIYMLKYEKGQVFWKFYIIPALYYLYGLFGSGYDFLQNNSLKRFFVLLIPDLIVLISYILLADIFKSTNENQMLVNDKNLVLAQLDASMDQIEQLRESEQQSAIYRHDFRHHLNYISACLLEQKNQEAIDYIAEINEELTRSKIICYTENESINLILSSYLHKAEELGITTSVTVSTSDFEKYQITDLCCLLSNALENALHACEKIHCEKTRTLRFHLYTKNRKLCMDLRNSFDGKPAFSNGLPVSEALSEPGKQHGIGTRSMAHIVEKYHGVYAFSVKNDEFIFLD